MATEVEIKLRLADPAVLRNRLREIGAEPRGLVAETNTFLDTTDHALLNRASGLRLRVARPLGESSRQESALLTFKGPLAAGTVRVREELETYVTSPDTLRTILTRLGYRAVLEFEKRRETWRLGSCLVEIDELPQLGWFVEIEGPDPTAIAAAAAQLRLSHANAVTATYADMVAEVGTETGGMRILRF